MTVRRYLENDLFYRRLGHRHTAGRLVSGSRPEVDVAHCTDSLHFLISTLQTCSMDAISPDSGLQRQPYTGESHMWAMVSKSVLFGLLLLVPNFLHTQTPDALQMVPKQDNWFAHPEILCSALRSRGTGLEPGGNWNEAARYINASIRR